jgi:hypothetical protein
MSDEKTILAEKLAYDISRFTQSRADTVNIKQPGFFRLEDEDDNTNEDTNS